MNKKIFSRIQKNTKENAWFDTPAFLIIIHLTLILFGLLICSQLYQYKTEILKFSEIQKEILLNKNILEEMKSKSGYLSSNTYILKSAKQNYVNKKGEGEAVLDVAKVQENVSYKEGDYLPEEVKNKPEKISDLWKKCIALKSAKACDVE